MVPYYLQTEELIDLQERTGASIAVLGQHISSTRFDTVWCDDIKATYDTTRWLVEVKGYQSVGYFHPPLSLPTAKRRFDAYLSAMHDLGMTVQPGWVQEGSFTVEGGQNAMHDLLKANNMPRAIIACNDLMAIGATNVALDANCRIPEDIAIVGFDDIALASLIRPPLTTIAQPPSLMGEQLAQMLFERIEGLETGPARHIELPLSLIERKSA
jgi:DNA-binding LacI/PurR family transcriptional regulator